MADMMEHADVLIGNYYHPFDPDTRLLTDMKTKVLDEETILDSRRGAQHRGNGSVDPVDLARHQQLPARRERPADRARVPER